MGGQVRWRRAGVAALAALATGGCAAGSGSALSVTSSAGARKVAARSTVGHDHTAASQGTARDSVLGYYQAVAAHDAQAASAHLSPAYLAEFGGRQAFAAWVANYRSLTELQVRDGKPADADLVGQHPGVGSLTMVPVSYTAELNKPSANEVNGRLDRFVLVGRSAAGAPWQVVEVDTSP